MEESDMVNPTHVSAHLSNTLNTNQKKPLKVHQKKTPGKYHHKSHEEQYESPYRAGFSVFLVQLFYILCKMTTAAVRTSTLCSAL